MTRAQLDQPAAYSLSSGTWDQRELDAMQRVIASGQFTMGENVRRFEDDFARFVGSKHALMVNSGSSANLLTVAAPFYRKRKPFKRGDEVIVPSLSWSTTYFPVHQYGMNLVFVDIDGETLNLDPRHLKKALSRRTRAVFVPHILGNPAAMDEIGAFCEKHGLELLEDTCESLGARLNGKQAGTFGLMGTYSTFYSHHITTMEGGVVVTDEEELYHILLSLRAHGWTRQLPTENRVTKKSDDPFVESFRFVLPGYNLRPTELSGAVGIEQVKKLPEIIRVRRENAKRFRSALSDDARFELQRETGESSWFGFSMILREKAPTRAKVLDALRANGIEVRPVVSGNFLLNDVVRRLNRRIVGRHANSQRVHERGFFVGNHAHDLGAQIDLLEDALRKV